MVSVVLTSNAACTILDTAADALSMTVISTATAAVTTSVNPGDTVCNGSLVLFTASPVNGGTAPSLIWMRNGVYAGVTGISYGLVPVNGDNIYCKLVSNLACVVTDTVSSSHTIMNVTTSLIPSVVIIPNTGTAIVSGQTVIFNTTVTNGGTTPVFQWFINDSLISGATSSTFTYSSFNNDDSVSCVVVSSGPCSSVTYNSVVMHVTTVGVAQVNEMGADVRLLPNPNNGDFTIKGTLSSLSGSDVNLEITDMLGQVVYKSTIMAQNRNINEHLSLKSNLANGMYILTLRSGSDNVVFHFVIGR